jgi:hypothetical protein
MGDMADFALDQVWDMEDARFGYLTGDISSEEAYDLGIIDERGYSTGQSLFIKSSKQCRHCGAKNLQWTEYHGKWRLANSSGEIHTCKEHKFDTPGEREILPWSR